MNLVTVLGVTFACVASVLLVTVFWVAYEGDRLHANHPGKYLLIPQALRQITPVDQCAPKTFGRSFRECGGICGEYVSVSFGTTAPLEALKQRYRMAPLLAVTGYQEAQIMLLDADAGLPPTCRRAIIELYDSYDQD